MAQQPSFNMSKVSSADRIVLGAAGLYFIWALLPFWYKYNGPGADIAGALGVRTTINGWHGPTVFAVILSIVALVWGGLRIAGVATNLNVKAGTVDVLLGGVSLLLTILGLVVQPTLTGPSWGLFVAILIAAAWTYGGYMKMQEPASSGAPPASTTGFGS